MLRIIFILFIIITSLFADRALQLKKMQNEGRVALVIGNADYKEQALKNPLNDAWAVKTALEERNFKVFYLENGKRRIMIQTMERFIRSLERSAIGLVYYAGHGVEVNGENFLIPVHSTIESEMDVKYEAISMTRLIADMQRTRSRLNIFVMDACRNNPYREATRGGAGGGLANVEAEGFFIAFATAPGKVAKDGKGDHGLFTNYFLHYIKKEGMPLREVFHNVRQNVYRDSNKEQLPLVRNGIGMGEFYFTLPKIVLPTQREIKPPLVPTTRAEKQAISKYKLYINALPKQSHIYITNIKPKYHDGILLKKGSYGIKVTASGYKTYTDTISIIEDTTLTVVLEKSAKHLAQTSNPSIHKGAYWKDPQTQLYWQDEIQKTSLINYWSDAVALSWDEAKRYCEDLTLNDYRDWRLPTLPELFGIIDYERYEPAIDKHIQNVASGFYWTDSKVVPDTSGFFSNMFGGSDEKAEATEAWVVYFLDGTTETATFSTDGHVRCVRGAKK
ncbi:MAG: caspase family protein [Campylobacterota bacterium]|nr:caspase family protein [Campylobacterota bacterium]